MNSIVLANLCSFRNIQVCSCWHFQRPGDADINVDVCSPRPPSDEHR